MDRTRTRRPPWSWEEARVLCLREARRVLRDRYEAEDAAQEAMLRAWRASARAHGVESPNAWLRTIAANEARRRWRTLSRTETVSEPIEAGSTATALAPEDELSAVAYEQLLASLPARDRELIHLRFVEDLSYVQIAASAGMPEATVKTRIHRSLARLRTLFSNEALG